MREPWSEQAREKRELAALIRRYAAGLEDADRQDLMAHADNVEAGVVVAHGASASSTKKIEYAWAYHFAPQICHCREAMTDSTNNLWMRRSGESSG